MTNLPDHQAYLEAPYVNAAKQEDDFGQWCAANDVDPEAPCAWDQFEAFLNEQQDEDPVWDADRYYDGKYGAES